MAENESPEVQEVKTPPIVAEAGQISELVEGKESLKRLIAEAVSVYKDIRSQVDGCIRNQEGAVGNQNAEVLAASLDPKEPDQENMIKGYLGDIAEGNTNILNRVKDGTKDLDYGEDPEVKTNSDPERLDVDGFLSAIKLRKQMLEQASNAIQNVTIHELYTAQTNSQSGGYSEQNRNLIYEKSQELMDKNREFITDVVRNLEGSKTLEVKIRAIETAWEELKQKLPGKN